MQNSKLGLDFTKVAHAKDVARKIADDVQKFVEQYSTVCSALTGSMRTPYPYPTCW